MEELGCILFIHWIHGWGFLLRYWFCSYNVSNSSNRSFLFYACKHEVDIFTLKLDLTTRTKFPLVNELVPSQIVSEKTKPGSSGLINTSICLFWCNISLYSFVTNFILDVLTIFCRLDVNLLPPSNQKMKYNLGEYYRFTKGFYLSVAKPIRTWWWSPRTAPSPGDI